MPRWRCNAHCNRRCVTVRKELGCSRSCPCGDVRGQLLCRLRAVLCCNLQLASLESERLAALMRLRHSQVRACCGSASGMSFLHTSAHCTPTIRLAKRTPLRTSRLCLTRQTPQCCCDLLPRRPWFPLRLVLLAALPCCGRRERIHSLCVFPQSLCRSQCCHRLLRR